MVKDLGYCHCFFLIFNPSQTILWSDKIKLLEEWNFKCIQSISQSLLDSTGMKYVFETAVNICKCLFLISELMASEWVRNSMEWPISGPPFEHHGPRAHPALHAPLLALARLVAIGVSPSSFFL